MFEYSQENYGLQEKELEIQLSSNYSSPQKYFFAYTIHTFELNANDYKLCMSVSCSSKKKLPSICQHLPIIYLEMNIVYCTV